MTAVDDAFPRDPATRHRAESRATQVHAAAHTTAREVTSGGHSTLRHTVGPSRPDHHSAAPATARAASVAQMSGRSA
ncbi:hypothetical protein AB0H07_27850 [Streptomyces sp. NPDC021354]|uniref:hypothetical protein n=1 Tax=Streptomyces sp. NPDC021354 TaxID=3154793 RepID=UPI0033F024E4